MGDLAIPRHHFALRLPRPPTLPDGTRWLFPRHRLVAYYGAADAPGLGVLGTGTPDAVWPALARQAKAYRTPRAAVLPAYELITYVATGSPGDRGDYTNRVPDRVIARYVAAARRHHAYLVLDIQPGRGRFLPDAQSLQRWLRLPFVGLALDPEWKLYGGQLPLSRIGHTDAGAVNAVSGWLDRLTRQGNLPQKLLLVHEFTDAMVVHKAVLKHRTRVALVFNVDGFGGRGAKVGKYRELAAGSRFPMGFKLFYRMDTPLLTPRETLRLRPRPVVIEYQ